MIRQLLLHKGDSPNELLSVIRQFIKEYPNGLSVTVEPIYQKRTSKQNALYQLLVHRLHTQSGMDEDYIRYEAKRIAIGWGYPVKRDNDGNPIEVNGTFVGISSSDACISDFNKLIDGVYQLALREKIVLGDIK